MLGSEDILILLFTFCAGFSLFANLKVGYGVFMGNPKFVGGSIAHIGIAIMCLGFVTSARYDSKTTVSLERGKPVETMGYRLTYLGYKELDTERYAFQVQVEHANVKKVVSPIMRFNTQENSTIRNPDLINFISRDFYVSPITVESGEEQREMPLTLNHRKPEQMAGLTVEFQGFEFTQAEREAMTEGKEFSINAILQITEGKIKKRIDLKMKSGPEGAAYIPASFVTHDGKPFEFTIKRMMPSQDDPAKSSVEVTVNFPPDPTAKKHEETLVIEATIKPMINLVWAGTITLVIGFLLTILRRTEEARNQGDKWRSEE
jgi:cytochrome c-type biogenesis protein CcmF